VERNFVRKDPYPFQISVDNTEAMHILQATGNPSQLNGMSARFLRDRVKTYELGAVRMPIPLNELIDISVFHPLGNQREPVFV